MSEPAPPLSFDQVAIDFAGHRMLRDGVEQPLEPKAFGVLALLTGSPGRVFGRDEILDAVWGHRHVTPGVLNRVMTLLRHALGEDAHRPRYLHTVHGVGYRFDLPAHALAPAAEESAPSASTASDSSAGYPTPSAHAAPRRRATDTRPAARARWVRPAFAITLVVVLGAGITRYWPLAGAAAEPPGAPAPARSVAVLPMVNASHDPQQQFFADGLSEHLIASLSRSDGLRVIGRASAFQFRESPLSPRVIGERLGAEYLMSGRVQRDGEVVRISAALVRAADGATLWADHYDRPYQNLFALQDEIAQAVAAALQARLLPVGAAQGDRPPGGNIEAYNAYLLGMQAFYAGKLRTAAARQAEAVRIEPAYAAAWAQLSIAWALQGAETEFREEQQTAYRHARAAVNRALWLAPHLGIAHGARGNLLLAADFDWDGAIAALRRAAELAPDDGQVRGGLSRALAASGDLQAALRERRRFLAIEPLMAANHYLHAQLLMASGALDEAESSIRFHRQLAPRAWASHQSMYVAILRGDLARAESVARQQPAPWGRMGQALAAQLAPQRAEARAALAQVAGDGTWARTSPYLMAQAHALRNDPGAMVEWLEVAWRQRDTNLHQTLYDPLLLEHRDDPRFIAFCRRIGLPDPRRSTALGLGQIRQRLARPAG
jgi:TolB-like protein/DNA-binding winged helix-turn-helix (wHTH) protein/Flp pilus assembly protein TadD